MWELIDTFIANERKFLVLDALALSLDRLWARAPDKVKERLRLITDRALKAAPDGHHIHETLARARLFRFLRTGDALNAALCKFSEPVYLPSQPCYGQCSVFEFCAFSL